MRIYFTIYENSDGDYAHVHDEKNSDGEYYVEVNNNYDKTFATKAELDAWLKTNNYEWAGCDDYSI